MAAAPLPMDGAHDEVRIAASLRGVRARTPSTQAIAQEAGAMLQVCFCGPATWVRARKKKMTLRIE